MRFPLVSSPVFAIFAIALAVRSGFADEVVATQPVGSGLPDVIAFGSCCKSDILLRNVHKKSIFDSVVAASPDLFLFLGDNIYGDSSEVDILESKYRALKSQPSYQKLLAQCPLMATWDDHDYGKDDAGEEFPIKRESQRAFLDFFDVPGPSPRRVQEGIYHSHRFGKEGGRTVQVIMLDTRYFRSPLKKGPGRPKYLKDEDAEKTMLGAVQWKWLEERLREPADLRIIGSSIQVIPQEHGWEKWDNFPHERQRLLKLIEMTGAGGVVLVSGDRHLAEISRIPAADDSGVGYPLFEVTSSGLTHAGGGKGEEANKWRVGESNFRELNFGVIRVDWDSDDPEVVMEVRNLLGEVELSQAVKLSALRSQDR